MKKLLFLLIFIPVFCFSQKRIETDSCIILKHQIFELQDSIIKLNKRPVMSVDQFVELFKYERLLGYYKRCKAKPVKWKYYKGWSIRVFEN